MAAELKLAICDYLEKAMAALDRYIESRDPEDLHQMRVAMKKARAPAWLLARIRPDRKFRHHLTPWISLFRMSGKVRDLEVQLKLLTSSAAPAPLLGLWSARVDWARTTFRSYVAANRKSLVNALERIRKDHLPFHPGKAMKIVRTEWAILKNPQAFLHHAGWHDHRKRIKRLMYFNSLLPAIANVAPPIPVAVMQRMDELQNVIGKWHDVQVVLDDFHDDPTFRSFTVYAREVLQPKCDGLGQDVRRYTEAFQTLASDLRP